jgi:hypothetical protein
MQPNYFWKGDASYPLDDTFRMITSAGDGMEFEMDEALLEGQKDCDLVQACVSANIWNTPSSTNSMAILHSHTI